MKKKTFEVTFELIPFTYNVEAKTEEEARQLAISMLTDDICSNPTEIITNTIILKK